MNTSNKPLLKDPNRYPTDEVLTPALKHAYKTYLKLIEVLVSYDIHLSWRYYQDGNVWLAKGVYAYKGTRGGQKVITVFWLSIWEGFFKITFYFSLKYRMDLVKLPLENNVKQQIQEAKPMGKLRFFPIVFDIHRDEGLEPVLFLLDYKKKNT